MDTKIIDNIGFVHVPRTAGGSLVNELGKTEWVILGHDVNSEFYLHLKDYRRNHAIDNTYLISTVRNPYDRLVSAYFYLMADGDNENDAKDKLKYLNPYQNFEEFVLKGLSWYRRYSTMKQIHLRPQYYWLSKNKKLLVDRVFKFEELDKLFEFVSKYSAIKEEDIMHVHASQRTQYEDYYTIKMKDVVYSCYKKDFELFNYKR